MTEKWEPKLAAERLAEIHVDVLDFVGRVDQGVSSADLYYIVDKAAALERSAKRLRELAAELIDEGTSLGGYTARIEATLTRAGTVGYRAAAALHPSAA